jgi:hypothetical protein
MERRAGGKVKNISMSNKSLIVINNSKAASKETVALSTLKHHPLRDKIYGREWTRVAIRRIQEKFKQGGVELAILPDGTVIHGHDDYDALKAAGISNVEVLVRHDLAGCDEHEIVERFVQDLTYKGFQSPIEQFRCELAKAGKIELLERADEIHICESCLAKAIGKPGLKNLEVMFRACGLSGPLKHLLDVGVLSPVIAAAACILSEASELAVVGVLDLARREAAGQAFSPDEAIMVDTHVMSMIIIEALGDDSDDYEDEEFDDGLSSYERDTTFLNEDQYDFARQSNEPFDDEDDDEFSSVEPSKELFDEECLLTKGQVMGLWGYLESKSVERCDDSLDHTADYLMDCGVSAQLIRDWFNRLGAFCDCSVLNHLCRGSLGAWALEDDLEDAA